MNIKPLVLVVEDDQAIRRILRSVLSENGFDIEETDSCEGGRSMESILHPDLVLIDLGLPDGDGLDLIRDIRKSSQVPMIVVSATDKEAVKVHALESGANDYVTKPFGVAELLARIKVALRHNKTPQSQGIMVFGNLSVNTDSRRVFLLGNEVHLTPLEYKLLFVMIQSPGKILTTRYLLKEVWGYDSDQQKHYVRILAAGLRKKIEPGPKSDQLLHTVSGVGYRFFN